MTKETLLEQILRDPRRFYRMPLDVIRDRRLDDTERTAILDGWERMISEGDSVGKTETLRAIVGAREEVGRRKQRTGTEGA